jgi:hypothetical protein
MTDNEIGVGVLEHIARMVEALEREIGLPYRFLVHMLQEPEDWSFLVKLHALCETTLTQALVDVVAQPALETNLRKLFLKTKIEFARAMGLLPRSQKDFLNALGPARNTVVHDVHQVASFSLRKLAETPPAGINVTHLFGARLQLYLNDVSRRVDPYRLALWTEAIELLLHTRTGREVALAEAEQRFQAEVAARSETDIRQLQEELLAQLAEQDMEDRQ